MTDPLKMRLAHDRGKTGEALEAKHGNFSEQFFTTTEAAIRKAPGVAEHVVSLLTASGGTEDRVDGTRDAPLPMSAQAFADVNEIYSLLVYWTRVFAAQLGMQPPGPAARAWRNDRGIIVGLPPDQSPGQARYTTGVMATWLTVNLERICNLDVDDVMGFRSNLRYIFHTDARWPQKEKPRWSDMPCPIDQCGAKIAIYPPRSFGDDELIHCTGDPTHHFPAWQYEHLIGVFKQIRAEQRQAASTAAHLLAKYGRMAS